MIRGMGKETFFAYSQTLNRFKKKDEDLFYLKFSLSKKKIMNS
jgi:hypothetical protein